MNLQEPETLEDWQIVIHQWAIGKGWWDKLKSRPITEVIADKGINIHGEISELWESARAGTLDAPCDKAEKMEQNGCKVLTCAEEELADIFIRLADLAGFMEIDLKTAVEQKHKFNITRPYRHGNKEA